MPSQPDMATQWRYGMDDGSAEAAPQDAASAADAGYMPPDSGPFECNNCQFFVADGQPCQKVAEPVQGEGLCTLFAPAGNETQAEEHTEGADPQQTAAY